MKDDSLLQEASANYKEVRAWWDECKDWMFYFKDQRVPVVFDF